MHADGQFYRVDAFTSVEREARMIELPLCPRMLAFARNRVEYINPFQATFRFIRKPRGSFEASHGELNPPEDAAEIEKKDEAWGG